MLCQISGVFRTPNGQVHPNVTISFRRAAMVHGLLAETGPTVVVPDEVSVTTNVNGETTIGLYPGRYMVSLPGSNGCPHQFVVFVPDEELIDFTALLTQGPEVNTGEWQEDIILGYANQAVTARLGAEAARDLAIAAADDAEMARDEVIAEAAVIPRRRGPWATGINYVFADLVQEGGSTYYCLVPHSSGVFNDDIGDVYWEVWAAKGNSGAGAGDVEAANAGSEYSGVAAAFRSNVGLVIGSDVQAYNQILQALATIGPSNDKAAYFTGAAALALYDVKAAGRAFVGGTTSVSFVAGTDAVGQGPIPATDRLVFIQTASAGDPAGVTLPVPVAGEEGKVLVIYNRTANRIRLYPTAGVILNTLAANTPILMPPRSMARVEQRGTGHWGVSVSIVDLGLAKQIQVMSDDGASLVWGDQTGRVLLAEKAASNVGQVSFTEFDHARFRDYEFILEAVKPVTDGVQLQMRVSGDGGASYDAGATDYSYSYYSHRPGAVATSTAVDGGPTINLSHNTVGNAAAEQGVSGSIKLLRASTGARVVVQGELSFWDVDGGLGIFRVSGARKATQITGGVRFLYSSGNIASMNIRMYGLKS